VGKNIGQCIASSGEYFEGDWVFFVRNVNKPYFLKKIWFFLGPPRMYSYPDFYFCHSSENIFNSLLGLESRLTHNCLKTYVYMVALSNVSTVYEGYFAWHVTESPTLYHLILVRCVYLFFCGYVEMNLILSLSHTLMKTDTCTSTNKCG
jgi:hypothetical protein